MADTRHLEAIDLTARHLLGIHASMIGHSIVGQLMLTWPELADHQGSIESRIVELLAQVTVDEDHAIAAAAYLQLVEADGTRR